MPPSRDASSRGPAAGFFLAGFASSVNHLGAKAPRKRQPIRVGWAEYAHRRAFRGTYRGPPEAPGRRGLLPEPAAGNFTAGTSGGAPG